VFTRKLGPLPTWGWIGIVGGLIVVWAMYSRSKASSTAASTTPSGIPADQVPDFINQTYVNTTAPSSTPAGGTTTTQTTAKTSKKESLLNLAKLYGQSESQFVYNNPTLIKYDTPSGFVPAGTTVVTGPAPTITLPGLPSPGTGQFPPGWPGQTTPTQSTSTPVPQSGGLKGPTGPADKVPTKTKRPVRRKRAA
jgi:hypothetical protein